jgi:hypothetical protein
MVKEKVKEKVKVKVKEKVRVKVKKKIKVKVKVKVKQFHYSPEQALRLPGSWGSKISKQSAQEVGRVASPRPQPPLAPRNIPGTHFFWTLSRPPGPKCCRNDYVDEKFQ